MQFSSAMFTLLTILFAYVTLSYAHQYVGSTSAAHFGQRPANPASGWSRGTNVHPRAWGPSSSSSSASYPAAKGTSGPYFGGTGPYPPPLNSPPPRFPVPNPPPDTVGSQIASSRASYPGVKGSSMSYRRGPPPRDATQPRFAGAAPNNPSRGLGPNSSSGTVSSQAAVYRIGDNQPPRPNSVPTAKCRAGDKVYKVGDKWSPEDRCGRHTCAVDGKSSFLGCPSLKATSDCTLSSEDLRQPWPSCCPQLQCSR